MCAAGSEREGEIRPGNITGPLLLLHAVHEELQRVKIQFRAHAIIERAVAVAEGAREKQGAGLVVGDESRPGGGLPDVDHVGLDEPRFGSDRGPVGDPGDVPEIAGFEIIREDDTDEMCGEAQVAVDDHAERVARRDHRTIPRVKLEVRIRGRCDDQGAVALNITRCGSGEATGGAVDRHVVNRPGGERIREEDQATRAVETIHGDPIRLIGPDSLNDLTVTAAGAPSKASSLLAIRRQVADVGAGVQMARTVSKLELIGTQCEDPVSRRRGEPPGGFAAQDAGVVGLARFLGRVDGIDAVGSGQAGQDYGIGEEIVHRVEDAIGYLDGRGI